MAEFHTRLPIHRGLVAERKARLQQIKAFNESPRRRKHLPRSDPNNESDGHDFRTAFGTPTTMRSSPLRSSRSLLSTYVSNSSFTDMLRRKPSAVTIAGPYVSNKDRSARSFHRTPTPYRPSDNSGSITSSTPKPRVDRNGDGTSADEDRPKLEKVAPEVSADVELHQPTPQSIRPKLADGLESRISDFALRSSGISRTPSEGKFARVVSVAEFHEPKGNEDKEQPDSLVRRVTSVDTIKTSATARTAGGGKREYIRGLLKGRSQTMGDEESQYSVDGGKGNKIKRIFSSRRNRTASDQSSNDPSAMTTEYIGEQVVVRKCNNAHESVAVMNEKGITTAWLTVTSSSWTLRNVDVKHRQLRCEACNCEICDSRT